jgi:hypothetical protein
MANKFEVFNENDVVDNNYGPISPIGTVKNMKQRKPSTLVFVVLTLKMISSRSSREEKRKYLVLVSLK